MKPWHLLVGMLLFQAHQASALPAFPGAQGWGTQTMGGRGGTVVHVTNLAASGTGSLQWAVSQPGARTVVFDTCGVIEGDVTIPHGRLTISGESSPGGGITIAGKLWAANDEGIDDIVVRFVRVRPQTLSGNQGDAIQFSLCRRVVFDHVSASWGSDETVDLYEADSVTVQWSIVGPSATHAGHPDGAFHNYGLINGPDGGPASIHHVLFAHHNHRTPAIANGPSDVVNNVVYNATTGFVHHNPYNDLGINQEGNWYRTGPDKTNINPFYWDDEDESEGGYHVDGNMVDDPGDLVGVLNDPWNSTYRALNRAWIDGKKRNASRYPTPGPIPTDAATAFAQVVARSGCLPRDTVDRQIVSEVANRSGSWGRRVPANLWSGLATAPRRIDTDRDGLPDDWEASHGRDPAKPDSHLDADADGWTDLEEWLHEQASIKIAGEEPASVVATRRPDPRGSARARWNPSRLCVEIWNGRSWSTPDGRLP